MLIAGMSILAPRHGINGAALAVVIADALWAVALAVLARRYAGHGADILAAMGKRGGA
jgi:Na+-driven multidrug efflux pump